MRLIPAAVVTQSSGTTTVPAQTDWVSVSKVIALELGFIGTMIAVLTGHGTPDAVSLAWALGGTLGLLRIGDVAANVLNVRSYLNAPQAASNGVVPQAANTPLISAPATPPGGNGV